MASTELSLLNDALAANGRRPVASVEENVGSTAAIALNALKRARLEILSRGFTFNRIESRAFPPDAVSSEIVVGEDVLSIDETVETSCGHDIVLQDGKLYNATDDTFEFDAPVYCTVVYDKAIADLPEVARLAIGARAAVKMAVTFGADRKALEMLQRADAQAYDALLEIEVDSFDESMYSSRGVYPALNRRRRRY